MSAQPQPSGTDPSGSDYEDLLGQWSDLESALAVVLFLILLGVSLVQLKLTRANESDEL